MQDSTDEATITVSSGDAVAWPGKASCADDVWSNYSDLTHDLTPNGGLVREIPLLSLLKNSDSPEALPLNFWTWQVNAFSKPIKWELKMTVSVSVISISSKHPCSVSIVVFWASITFLGLLSEVHDFESKYSLLIDSRTQWQYSFWKPVFFYNFLHLPSLFYMYINLFSST